MPEVQQMVRFSKKDIREILTAKAKELSNPPAGSSNVNFSWPTGDAGEGDVKEELVIATVVFNCNGSPQPRK